MKKLIILAVILFALPVFGFHGMGPGPGVKSYSGVDEQGDTRYLENGTVIRTMEDGTTTRHHEQYVLTIRTAEDGTANRLLEDNTTERTHER